MKNRVRIQRHLSRIHGARRGGQRLYHELLLLHDDLRLLHLAVPKVSIAQILVLDRALHHRYNKLLVSALRLLLVAVAEQSVRLGALLVDRSLTSASRRRSGTARRHSGRVDAVNLGRILLDEARIWRRRSGRWWW